MAGRFLICGLPRSRTAWFAVASTTPTSVCFHEPLHRLQSFAELREFWVPKFGVDIGISDSGLAPQLPRILAELQPRTLIVLRPLADAIGSFKAYAARIGLHVDESHCERFTRAAQAGIEAVRGNPLVKTVDYAALDDYNTVRACMEWILPDTDLPDLRTLMNFNIQVAAQHIRKIASEPHSGWHLESL